MRRGNIQRFRAIFIEAVYYLEGFYRVIDMLVKTCYAVSMSTVSEHLDFLFTAVFATDLTLIMLIFFLLLLLLFGIVQPF